MDEMPKETVGAMSQLTKGEIPIEEVYEDGCLYRRHVVYRRWQPRFFFLLAVCGCLWPYVLGGVFAYRPKDRNDPWMLGAVAMNIPQVEDAAAGAVLLGAFSIGSPRQKKNYRPRFELHSGNT